MKHQIPNTLTILRVLVIPVLILSFFIPGKTANVVAAALFAFASLTDYFDGYLARAMEAQSNFGRCLDPIADKLLVATAILMLVHFSARDMFITIPGLIIMCREILVSGLREYLASSNVAMPVTKLAKWKTAIQMIALILLLLGERGSEYALVELFTNDQMLHDTTGSLITMIGKILFSVAAILTTITGYIYLKIGLKHM
ncbi:CDP-diacylglycerol--glycerol-3-phosphate 3-phosphatidyltransferase [Pseudomonadota bacterium]